MPNYAVQIVMFPASNVIEDATTNTWSCEAADSAGALLFTNAVVAFYNGIRDRFSTLTRQNNHVYKIFDRADPTPRQPVLEGLWNFTAAPTGNPLPPEVAKCLSFQGVAVSGVPQARRRGRVYLGPFNTSTLGTNGRPTTALTDDIRDDAQVLLTASKAATTWFWTVWSDTLGTGVEVDNGWVDDEWDTMRSRGRDATYRDLFV